MSYLRLRITLNKGNRGIALNKLENIIEEMRKFLSSMGDDIALVEPNSWVGVDFKNSSLEFTSEYVLPVDTVKHTRFNGAIIALARSEYPSSLLPSTSEHFFNIASFLDSEENADIAIFNEDETPLVFEINRRTATIARFLDVLPFRESEGAIQGKIHALYKESRPPYFVLRELSTDDLINCHFAPDDYPAIIKALERREAFVHVQGTIVTETRKRKIDHITVKNILIAEPYGFEDVEKFLQSGNTQ